MKDFYSSRSFCLALAFIPFLMLLMHVALSYHPYPLWDHLDIITLLERYYNNSLTFYDLFEPYGGHWRAGGYFISIPVAIFTGWNTLYECLASILFATAAFTVLAKSVKNSYNNAGINSHFYILLPLLSLFVFSLDQSGNWLWGFQVAVSMSIFFSFVTIALLCIDEIRFYHTLLAASFTLLGTLCATTSLLLLPIGLLILIVHPHISNKDKLFNIFIWIVCSFLIVYYYYIVVYQHTDLKSEQYKDLVKLSVYLVVFILNYIGSAITRFADDLAPLFTIIGICLALWSWFRLIKHYKIHYWHITPYASYMLYGLGSAFLTAIGRQEFGTDQAFVSRYISFSNFFWIGFIPLIVMLYAKMADSSIYSEKTMRSLVIILSVITIMKIANGFQVANKNSNISKVKEKTWIEISKNYPDYDKEMLKSLYWNQNIAAHYVDIMHEHKLGPFR